MSPIVISRILLREIAQDDLPRLFEFNLDRGQPVATFRANGLASS